MLDHTGSLMSEPIRLHTVAPLIAQIFPVATLVHVGAGGAGSLVSPNNASRAILIEAEPARLQKLRQQHTGHHDARFIDALVGPKAGMAKFYSVSVEVESGMVSAETLKSIWPRISLQEARQTNMVPLADILTQNVLPDDDIGQRSWLVVSCLPSGDIIAGGDALLERFDVIVARAVIGEGLPPELRSSDQKVLKENLQNRGFTALFHEVDRNSRTTTTLFVRAWKDLALKRDRQLADQHISHQRSLAERQAAFEESEKSHKARVSAVEEQLTDAQATVTQLTEERDAAKRELDDLRSAHETLTTERHDLAQALDDHKARVSAVEEQLTDAQARITQLTEERDRAKKKELLAENNLEATRENHAQIATQLLAREEELARLGNQVRQILAASDASRQQETKSSKPQTRSNSPSGASSGKARTK
jgi:predicted  nucleic acid-binding Zn-ribbon protein